MLRKYFNVRDELSLWNGSCLACDQQAVIPTSLRRRVLDLAREGHLGMVKMKQRCRETVWWPGLDQNIEEMVRSCAACVLSCKSLRRTPGLLQPVPWPENPWEKLQTDIVGDLCGAPSAYRYLVVIHDFCWKWPEVFPTSHVTSAKVINCLEDLFSRWGLPKCIVTDNGLQFVSAEFPTYLSRLGIHHSRTATYHPQANGAVERF
jgi:transposase InsO family protein